jgi:transposase
MVNIKDFDVQIERVDDIPVLYGLLQKMGIQATVDQVIRPHGNWQGLSPGWVITIWLIHILTQHSHQMDCVRDWVSGRLHLLRRLTKQKVTVLDFTDDRLALCLRYLSDQQSWGQLEENLAGHLIRVYDLKSELSSPWLIRFDATVGSVDHDPGQHTLFKVGKAKNGLYETQFKMMLASLDPLGLPLAVDVVPGDRADDPLYVPSYQRIKAIIPGQGLLAVGDSKMSALLTRAVIASNQDYYLTPLAYLKDEPELLDQLLKGWSGREAEMELIFLSEDLPADGSDPAPELAIARGFEDSRPCTAIVAGETVTWTERLLVICSFSYAHSMQQGLQRRLDKAQKALCALTPPRQQGKRQIKDEASLLSAIESVEKQYRVQGLFSYEYHQEVKERQVRGYKGKPARIERKVRYQLTVTRNEEAIGMAEFKAGWRIYATNAPQSQLSLSQAVWAYRDQYLAENIFRRLQGKILSITPVYVQRDDHAQGLFHLLTIAARLLALGDYTAKESLAQEQAELTGIYAGNPKRGTATPTTERMLRAFDNIHLMVMTVEEQIAYQLSPLSEVQERILSLLELPNSLYTALQAT